MNLVTTEANPGIHPDNQHPRLDQILEELMDRRRLEDAYRKAADELAKAQPEQRWQAMKLLPSLQSTYSKTLGSRSN